MGNFQNCILSAKSELAEARKLIQAQISNYPTPIAGCDAQFNHLLAERQKVLSAINSLDEAVFVPTPRSPTQDSGVESR